MHSRDRHGAAAVLVAICLVPLLMVTALVLDGGVLMARRRQAQAVADASAHAAACLLAKNYLSDAGKDPHGKARDAAIGFAALNSLETKNGIASVVVNIPPTSGSFAKELGNVEVIVTYNQPRCFSAMFGSGTIPITARSVGRTILGQPASILILDPSASGAFSMSGGAKLTTNGGIQVNSTNAAAVKADNGAFAENAGGMNIVGGYSLPGWAGPSNFFSETPLTNQPNMTDPYAELAAPDEGKLGKGKGPAKSSGSQTISPGVFDGGLSLGGGSKITMKPGVYFMKNGGFTVANGVEINGSGVMIFIDKGGGSLNFQGGAKINLTPPTSGDYSGIAFYQDRNNKSSVNIANGAKVNMTGTIYAPNGAVAIAGGAHGANYGTQFIVKSLNITNGVKVTINTPDSAIKTTSPFLAE